MDFANLPSDFGNGLFDVTNTITTATVRKDNSVLKSPSKQHPFFCNVDPAADYSIWTYDDIFYRKNGKTYTYPTWHKQAGKTLECTLLWCLHNANTSFRKQEEGRTKIGDWKTFDKSFTTWAEEAGCSVQFLIASILATKIKTIKNSPVYDYAMMLVEDIEQ